MKLQEFVTSLGGREHPGARGYVFKIAEWSRSQIEDKAGVQPDNLAINGGAVQMRFRLEDGIAVVQGVVSGDNIISHALLILGPDVLTR